VVYNKSLGSFGQFLHTKINLSKLFNYKCYILNFVNMLAKKNSFQSPYPTILRIWRAKKLRVRNMASCFPYNWKGHWFLWDPRGNFWKSIVLWWQVLLFVHFKLCKEFVKKYPY
jgi:hypothetical protein